MTKPQTTDEILSLEERTKRMAAMYNIAISDAVTTCQNILSEHDYMQQSYLLEEKLIGALCDLRRKYHDN